MKEPKVYVGNLSYDVNDIQLRDFFIKFGEISAVKLISDYETGRSKGFGFITYTDDKAVTAAIEAADNTEFEGRTIKVSRAKDKESNRGGRGQRDFNGNGDFGGW